MNSKLDDLISTTQGRIDAWRAQARVIADQATAAEQRGAVDPEDLVFIEQLATAMFKEMADLDAARDGLGALDEEEINRFARIGDGVRLVLLEITELGNRMYRVEPEGGAILPEWIHRAEALRIPAPVF